MKSVTPPHHFLRNKTRLKNLAGIVVLGIVLLGLVVSLSGCVEPGPDPTIISSNMIVGYIGEPIRYDIVVHNLGNSGVVTVWGTVTNDRTGFRQTESQEVHMTTGVHTVTLTFFMHGCRPGDRYIGNAWITWYSW
jgi:isopentenyl phosphate kinase